MIMNITMVYSKMATRFLESDNPVHKIRQNLILNFQNEQERIRSETRTLYIKFESRKKYKKIITSSNY
jgi:hypothetical protein